MSRAAVILLPLLALIFSGVLCFADQYTRTVSYEGEVLIKCSSLERESIQSLLESDGVDVWHVGEGGSVDFRVSSEQFQRMKGDLPGCREAGSVEDIVRREEQRRAKSRLNETQQEWFEEYHRYDAIVEWWKKLAEDNPDLVKYVESIGKSFEGRDQPAVHITASTGSNVKKLYFQCQIHAREWISGAVCMYIANELLESFKNGNNRVEELLTNVEIIYVPFANPDGYEYTWTNSRLWRKNRQLPPSGSACYGVDLNRNYDDHWGEGSSGNPCSETYHGSSPASEPETQNSQNYFKEQGNIVGSVDWHSFGQLILRPYGWTLTDTPDEVRLKELGDKMSADIFEAGGSRYVSQKASELYVGSGSAMDWFYSEDANSNNLYRAASFTIELRDNGFYGFELPPSEIEPNGKELVEAIINFGLEIQENPIPPT